MSLRQRGRNPLMSGAFGVSRHCRSASRKERRQSQSPNERGVRCETPITEKVGLELHGRNPLMSGAFGVSLISLFNLGKHKNVAIP